MNDILKVFFNISIPFVGIMTLISFLGTLATCFRSRKILIKVEDDLSHKTEKEIALETSQKYFESLSNEELERLLILLEEKENELKDDEDIGEVTKVKEQ